MQRSTVFRLGILGAALALTAGLARPARAQVTVAPLLAPSSFYAFPRNGAVVLSWTAPASGALVGFNVYRRDAGTTADKAVLMNAQPIIPYSVVDAGSDNKGLQNGNSYIYSVKGVYIDSTSKMVEGPATRDIVVTPQVPVKGLFFLHNIQTLNPGNVALDSSNILTIQGSGNELWDTQDAHSFLAVPVSGDFQVTVKLNERPTKATTGTSNSGKIGLEIKTDLQVGTPYALIFASVTRDPNEFLYEGRKNFGGGDANQRFSQGPGTASADAKFPALLRLVRKGAVISAFVSQDNGATFQQAGDDQDYGTLPATVYVGIVATALSDGDYVQGKLDFSTLKIENAP